MNLWRAVACTKPVPRATYRATRWASTERVSVFKRDSSINTMRKYVERNLQKGKYQAALEVVSKHMGSTTLHNRSRFESYESAVNIFLEYGHTVSAKGLHTRMRTEGFIPSLRLRASMTILHGYLKAQPLKSVLAAARKAVALEGFSEETLRYLLRIIFVNLPCSSTMIEGVVHSFMRTCHADYELSPQTKKFLGYLHTRLGSEEIAAKWVPPSGVEVMTRDRKRLFAMAGSDPKVQSVIQSAILRLDKNDKDHDRTLYNSLIEVFFKKRDYPRAFRIYRLMFSVGEAISPNATTYKLIFDALTIGNQPRNLRTRKYKMPLDAAPRKLFQGMTFIHAQQPASPLKGTSPVISIHSLTAALQTFMRQDDYAAAFVVLRTFYIHNYKLPVKAYTIVIEALVRRIRKESRFVASESESRELTQWMDRFLGHRRVPYIPDDAVFVDAILNIGLQPQLTLKHIPLSSKTQLHAFLYWSGSQETSDKAVNNFLELSKTPYRIPGSLVVIGLLKAWDDKWDVVPLQRILRRAILALYVKLFMRPAKAISIEILEAKQEMLYVKR
ncbi:hypothetical protein BDY19DRAFT_513670 [Irpex rosettiformis]|uniref:Uncharacterized protein n=1 Tax=Irpex rosettiformis TaxID=378272 RepID=A0ACB8UEY6_9APHY|nr:hypothetical protein BDY19DRAFT_513670 [Irpex rosettiformis]